MCVWVRYSRALQLSASDDIAVSPLLRRHLRSHDHRLLTFPFWTGLARLEILWGTSAPSGNQRRQSITQYASGLLQFKMLSKVLCAIWMNASKEIASNGRFWEFKNASWSWMKWYALQWLLKKIKEICRRFRTTRRDSERNCPPGRSQRNKYLQWHLHSHHR